MDWFDVLGLSDLKGPQANTSVSLLPKPSAPQSITDLLGLESGLMASLGDGARVTPTPTTPNNVVMPPHTPIDPTINVRASDHPALAEFERRYMLGPDTKANPNQPDESAAAKAARDAAYKDATALREEAVGLKAKTPAGPNLKQIGIAALATLLAGNQGGALLGGMVQGWNEAKAREKAKSEEEVAQKRALLEVKAQSKEREAGLSEQDRREAVATAAENAKFKKDLALAKVDAETRTQIAKLMNEGRITMAQARDVMKGYDLISKPDVPLETRQQIARAINSTIEGANIPIPTTESPKIDLMRQRLYQSAQKFPLEMDAIQAGTEYKKWAGLAQKGLAQAREIMRPFLAPIEQAKLNKFHAQIIATGSRMSKALDWTGKEAIKDTIIRARGLDKDIAEYEGQEAALRSLMQNRLSLLANPSTRIDVKQAAEKEYANYRALTDQMRLQIKNAKAARAKLQIPKQGP